MLRNNGHFSLGGEAGVAVGLAGRNGGGTCGDDTLL